MGYAELYQRSLTDPDGFWLEQASNIPWIKVPTVGSSQDDNGAWRWFEDGQLNTCYVALDQHVEAGRGDQVSKRLEDCRS